MHFTQDHLRDFSDAHPGRSAQPLPSFPEVVPIPVFGYHFTKTHGAPRSLGLKPTTDLYSLSLTEYSFRMRPSSSFSWLPAGSLLPPRSLLVFSPSSVCPLVPRAQFWGCFLIIPWHLCAAPPPRSSLGSPSPELPT